MNEITVVNGRRLIYQRHALDINWDQAMTLKNWLLLVIIEGKDKHILSEISKKSVDYGACYVCCVGEQGQLLHDMIDGEIILREIVEHQLPQFDVTMTTWHSDLNEALWFAFFVANNPPETIETILCLDASALGVEIPLDEIIKSWDQ